MIPFYSAFEKKVNKVRENTGVRLAGYPLLVLGVVLLFMSFVFMPIIVSYALSLALFIAPVWLPILVGSGAWMLWVTWRRSDFIADQNYVLLEIKPPRNIVKTPLAMEAMLSGLHQSGGESTWYKKFILGSIRPSWSLEVVSIGGQVRFFIWSRANFRKLVETNIYAQYPGAQITEARDYTRLLPRCADEYGVWGCDYKHTTDDPVPIKTYVEYGLDKVQKEPEQIDPLANLIEFMGSIGKGEQLWIQIIIRVHKGEKYDKKNKEGKNYTWKDSALELVDEIRKKTRDPYIDPATGEERPGFPNPTKGQSEKIAAIERNVSKLAFDVGVRGAYIVEPGAKFDVINISALIGLFKQFSSEGWNGIVPTGWFMIFDDYPWEFLVEKLKQKTAIRLIDAFRRRQFFYEPHVGKEMVMSTEELATIYHLPSRAVETPSMGRIQSATGEAPANLPI